MKQIPLLQGKALLVELPKGAKHKRVEVRHLGCFLVTTSTRGELMAKLPPGNWRIMGMLSDMTEEQAEKLVEFGDREPGNDRYVLGWKDYEIAKQGEEIAYMDYSLDTALESLDSAIIAEGYRFDSDPKPIFSAWELLSPAVDTDTPIREWQQSQSRVLDRSRCLLLGGYQG